MLVGLGGLKEAQRPSQVALQRGGQRTHAFDAIQEQTEGLAHQLQPDPRRPKGLAAVGAGGLSLVLVHSVELMVQSGAQQVHRLALARTETLHGGGDPAIGLGETALAALDALGAGPVEGGGQARQLRVPFVGREAVEEGLEAGQPDLVGLVGGIAQLPTGRLDQVGGETALLEGIGKGDDGLGCGLVVRLFGALLQETAASDEPGPAEAEQGEP